MLLLVAVLMASTALAAHAEPRPVDPTVRPAAVDVVRPVHSAKVAKRPSPTVRALPSAKVEAARWPSADTGTIAAISA